MSDHGALHGRRTPETGDATAATRSTARRPALAVALLALAVWLIVGHMIIGYPPLENAYDAANRATGAGIVLFCTGLYLFLVRVGSVALGISLATGLLLGISAVLLPTGTEAALWHHLLSAAAVCAVVVTMILRRR
ncbi:hypothetical protein [Nocardioides sp. SYSU DS0651]|uniref:hypothetical protein n=1 Tax=Nocardioides sp. SYSU DS0651 TaxID=3415955 RepID=UPI003F4C0B3E